MGIILVLVKVTKISLELTSKNNHDLKVQRVQYTSDVPADTPWHSRLLCGRLQSGGRGRAVMARPGWAIRPPSAAVVDVGQRRACADDYVTDTRWKWRGLRDWRAADLTAPSAGWMNSQRASWPLRLRRLFSLARLSWGDSMRMRFADCWSIRLSDV